MTNTWVTAPTRQPFWRIGLPLMPCTMPPVAAQSSGSVTVSITRVQPLSLYTRLISTAYSFGSLPLTVEIIEALPV